MSSCASTTSVLPPPARGVAVKISLPGREIAVDQLDLGAVGAFVDDEGAGQVEQRDLDLPADRRQAGRRARDVGANQRGNDLAIVRRRRAARSGSHRRARRRRPSRRGREAFPASPASRPATMSAVPSAGSAAVRSAATSGVRRTSGGAAAADGGGSAFDDGGNVAGIGVAPAASSRNKAPKSTPGRIAVTSSSL